MARQTVAAQTLTHGTTPAAAAIVAADDARERQSAGHPLGDRHQVGYDAEKVFLLLENTTGGSLVVTIKANQTIDTLVVPDLSITIGANAKKLTKQFPHNTYRQSDGYVYVNTAADGISMSVLKLPTS